MLSEQGQRAEAGDEVPLPEVGGEEEAICRDVLLCDLLAGEEFGDVVIERFGFDDAAFQGGLGGPVGGFAAADAALFEEAEIGNAGGAGGLGEAEDLRLERSADGVQEVGDGEAQGAVEWSECVGWSGLDRHAIKRPVTMTGFLRDRGRSLGEVRKGGRKQGRYWIASPGRQRRRCVEVAITGVGAQQTPNGEKFFWFFFSKKNCLLALPTVLHAIPSTSSSSGSARRCSRSFPSTKASKRACLRARMAAMRDSIVSWQW